MAGRVVKPPQPRNPPPAGDRISDAKGLLSFIANSPRWKELAPELARDYPKPTPQEYERARQRELKDSHLGSHFPDDFLEEVAMDSKYEATQRRQLERLRFLLEGNYLAGPALEETVFLKREYETGQRRYQWREN
jgi:hypothetical protein